MLFVLFIQFSVKAFASWNESKYNYHQRTTDFRVLNINTLTWRSNIFFIGVPVCLEAIWTHIAYFVLLFREESRKFLHLLGLSADCISPEFYLHSIHSAISFFIKHISLWIIKVKKAVKRIVRNYIVTISTASINNLLKYTEDNW